MSSSTPKIAILDSARGVCAFIVGLYHLITFENQHGSLITSDSAFLSILDPFINGSICVFFIISGYVMYLHLERNKYTMSLFLPFMAKRAIRIMLPMFACVALILAVNIAFQLHLGEPISVDVSQFLANITLTANFVGEEWYNPIFWTLAIEMQFYLFLGLGYLVIRKNAFISFLILGLLAFGLNTFFDTRGTMSEFASYFFIGIAMSLYRDNQLSAQQLILITAIGTIDFIMNQAQFYYGIPLISVPLLLFADFKSRWLEFLGTLSYSFYLTHGLFGGTFLYLTLRYANQDWQKVLLFLTAFVLAYIGSYFFYLLVEKPSMQLTRYIRYKHKLN